MKAMVIEDPKTHWCVEHRCVNWHPVYSISADELRGLGIPTYVGAHEAIRAGWRFHDNHWYCPECAKQKRRDHRVDIS